jgi:hypothetical protein
MYFLNCGIVTVHTPLGEGIPKEIEYVAQSSLGVGIEEQNMT